MRRTIHFCQSVDGALKHWSKNQWQQVAKDNKMTLDAVKERFRIYQFEGKKVIPIGEPCEGFSYVDGCPGHPTPTQKAGDDE